MNTPEFTKEIELRRELLKLLTEQTQLSNWEKEKALEIKHLIMQQGQLEEDILRIEISLAALKSKGQSNSLLSRIGRLL